MKRCVVFFAVALSIAPPIHAQSQPESAPRHEPKLRRWLDIQSFSVDTRYRFTTDNKNVRSTNQLQYKDSLRARFNLDSGKRYTVSVGYFTGNSFVSTEQYRRVNPDPAAGFGLWAERTITKHVRLQGGYVSVDQRYGGWNADRVQSGRHFFLNATLPVYGPLSASIYATRALSAPYAVSVGRRFDALISYDVLRDLRRTGIF